MRIAYLINQYPQTSHSFIRREIQALERLGVQVARIAFRGRDAELVDPEDQLERKRTRFILQGPGPLLLALIRLLITRPLPLMRALLTAVRMSRGSERAWYRHLIYLLEACCIFILIRKEVIQHVHAHFGTNSAEVAMLVQILGGPPWSFTVHGPEEFDKAAQEAVAEKLRACRFAVAISSYGRSQLFRLVEHPYWKKIHVVHCGLDPAFHSGPIDESSSARLLCVGRLCEQKGHILLMEAAAKLRDQGVIFELVLAGDGELRPEIQGLIERYHLKESVRVTGWISGKQVREELLAARALVLPSFAEGLPVVIMEAMALGRPVISTFVAGIPELVISGEHGWLVPAGDVEALVSAIKACLDAPPDVLARMGRAARTRALSRHDVDTEAAKLVALFRSSIDAERD